MTSTATLLLIVYDLITLPLELQELAVRSFFLEDFLKLSRSLRCGVAAACFVS